VKGAAASAALAGTRRMWASPLGLPPALQLYSVREFLPKDYEGTLRQLGAMGYRECEAAGFYGHSAKDVKRAMEEAGLRCVSSHHPMADLQGKLDEILEFGTELGLGYLVCSSPMVRHPVEGQSWLASLEGMTLDDWRWNAEQLNRIGGKVHAAGMQFAYHNDFVEFHPFVESVEQDDVVPYDELLKLTDPKLVAMEMDCGWVMIGGKQPEFYLRKYPERYVMLHIKDFNLTGWRPGMEPVSTEMGRGSIDYASIFAAAKEARAPIRHIFVEQEAYPDMPAMEALKVDADWVKGFKR